jgi:hypothetical protein
MTWLDLNVSLTEGGKRLRGIVAAAQACGNKNEEQV